jgi:hypothetical protein
LPAFLFSAGVFVSTSVAEELFSDNPIDWFSRLGLDLLEGKVINQMSVFKTNGNEKKMNLNEVPAAILYSSFT